MRHTYAARWAVGRLPIGQSGNSRTDRSHQPDFERPIGACRTGLRVMWRPLLVIRVSQLMSRAADHR